MAVAFLASACQTPTLEDRRSLKADPLAQAERSDPGAPSRVVLITVAGLESADFLDPWGHVAGPGEPVRMPQLARLAREGALGVAAHPPSPGASRTAHATLATGLLPIEHGVIADATLDKEGTRSLPFLDSRMLGGVPLWDAAIGRGVLALDWPTTSLARIELLIPEVGFEEGMSWIDQIRPRSTPMLVRTLVQSAAEDLDGEPSGGPAGPGQRDPITWPTAAEKDAALVDVACAVAASERDPGLWLLRLSQTEVSQRDSGVGSVENDAALAAIDSEIGRLLECLELSGRLAETAVFVVGDVAYQSVHTSVAPNVALVQSGLIGRDPRSAIGVRSWLALVRSHGRSAYVYARDAANALAARDVLEAEARRTGAFRVVSAKELADAGADPQAWFGLVAAPGYQIGNEMVGPAIRPSEERAVPGVLGLGDPPSAVVGFVAWGRGIRPKVRLSTLELVDVAPTIAGLLGLRLGEDVDGREIRGIMRAAVAPPPPGPKRLGVEGSGKASDYLRGRRAGEGGR